MQVYSDKDDIATTYKKDFRKITFFNLPTLNHNIKNLKKSIKKEKAFLESTLNYTKQQSNKTKEAAININNNLKKKNYSFTTTKTFRKTKTFIEPEINEAKTNKHDNFIEPEFILNILNSKTKKKVDETDKLFFQIFDKKLQNIMEIKQYNQSDKKRAKNKSLELRNFANKNFINRKIVNLKGKIVLMKGVVDYTYPQVIVKKVKESKNKYVQNNPKSRKESNMSSSGAGTERSSLVNLNVNAGKSGNLSRNGSVLASNNNSMLMSTIPKNNTVLNLKKVKRLPPIKRVRKYTNLSESNDESKGIPLHIRSISCLEF